jgi:predicted phosphodiesterase
MRIAVLGDIHGNIFGLEAALADLRGQRPDAMLLTGDLVYKLPWGAEVIDLLRTLPHQAVIGNAELYLALWDTPLWPADRWDLPLGHELVEWERARLGPRRLAWLASLPEYVALSAGRIEDLLVVHGVPGNPFLPFLPRPSEDRSPWVQSDARIQELLGGADADVIVCGHTHTVMARRVKSTTSRSTLIINPGSLSYGRGNGATVGSASYALLDWSAAGGWQVTFREVTYDPAPLHAALLALRDDYPVAAYVANRMRPPGLAAVPEPRMDLGRFRWGEAPPWWDRRDDLPEWRALRGDHDG